MALAVFGQSKVSANGSAKQPSPLHRLSHTRPVSLTRQGKLKLNEIICHLITSLWFKLAARAWIELHADLGSGSSVVGA